MSNTLLELQQVEKDFFSPSRIQVLRGISFTLKAAESLAIVGASGEGKSTLLHIAGGLEKPTKGVVLFANKPLFTPKQRNQGIGFVFQSFHLLEDISAIQNVLMPASIARKEKEYAQRALDLLEQVGLSHRKHFPVKYLSGGEKQRLCIARALCLDPPLLIADEPSGNLDTKNSQKIHELLIQLTKEHQKALLIATHEQELADLCDQTFILAGGLLDCEKEKITVR